MKKLIIILLFITTSLHAEKIERLGFYNIQEILGDDKLTYKILKGCVSMNSAVTEIIKEEHPDLAKEFFETANYLYPFGILVLKKIKNINHQEAEKEYFLFFLRLKYRKDKDSLHFCKIHLLNLDVLL